MTMVDAIKEWLAGNIAWALIVKLLAISYLSNLVLWPLGKVFGLFTSKMQATATILLAPFFIFLLLFAISLTNQTTSSLLADSQNVIIFNNRPDTDNPTFAILIAEIINRGTMASIARSFQLESDIDGTVYHGAAEMLPPVFPVHGPNGTKITLYGIDALYNKANNPISPGGSVTGLLMFKFDVPESAIMSHKTTFTLSFADALGNVYSLSVPWSSVSEKEFQQYIPGLSVGISRPGNTTQGAPNAAPPAAQPSAPAN